MTLPHRLLGSTELKVSAVGLGTTKLGRNTDVKYPHSFEIPDDKQVLNLLAMAQDLNINLIDTAPAYGTAEERLGKLLQGQRQKWVIVGKSGENYDNQKSSYNFTKEHILESIKRSLQRLRTDYIDLLLIHSDGDDVNIINNYDVFGTLDLAKKQGLIRYSGMSTKTVAGGLLTLQYSDAAMVMYNPLNTEELPVITAAHEMHKGILVKKALVSGHIDKINNQNPVQTAMDFIYKEPGVSSVILGTINPQHLKTNVQCAARSLAHC
jgi:aryl-alcohol dehydrogenase-like predicted oxidoreductase